MGASLEESIFRAGSSTYYFSSKFFPAKIREDVFKLYSFVRVADDYVDQTPPQAAKFEDLCAMWAVAATNMKNETWNVKDKDINKKVTRNMAGLVNKYNFEQKWIEAFLGSMRADIDGRKYKKLEDSLEYVYGSAEVVGLMMAKIMGLPDEAMEFARLQGRAMQWINFIRDIDEDNQLGRLYFPTSDLKRFNLPDLLNKTAGQKPEEFKAFMRLQLGYYQEWQAQARKGYSYIPRRLRISLHTAADMYDWTAKQIEKDPMIVFTRKIKPRKRHVIVKGLANGRIIIPGF